MRNGIWRTYVPRKKKVLQPFPGLTITAFSPSTNPNLPGPSSLTMHIGRKKSRNINSMRVSWNDTGNGITGIDIGRENCSSICLTVCCNRIEGFSKYLWVCAELEANCKGMATRDSRHLPLSTLTGASIKSDAVCTHRFSREYFKNNIVCWSNSVSPCTRGQNVFDLRSNTGDQDSFHIGIEETTLGKPIHQLMTNLFQHHKDRLLTSI